MRSKQDILDHLDAFTRAHLECALWTSTDNATEDGGSPLDENFGIEDFSCRALQSLIADCHDFQKANKADLNNIDPAQCGHDFWLSRNGHGAGFWDRGLGAQGDRLHKATKPYGSVDLFVRRGKIEVQ